LDAYKITVFGCDEVRKELAVIHVFCVLVRYVSKQYNKVYSGKYSQYPRISSKLAWGIASLHQTTDFTPGYIAERSCREELLGLTDMMMSLTQLV
jgi:hypothetical protein